MEENTPIKIPRRKFLSWLIPIGAAGMAFLLFRSVYTNTLATLFSRQLMARRSAKMRLKRKKGKTPEEYSEDTLIINTKSNIVHFRSKKVFTYYDKITPAHAGIVGFDDWQRFMESKNAHFRKGKSGVILEHISLRALSAGVTIASLETAIKILSMAFSETYYLNNVTNWRVYDLLLKYLALSGKDINESWTRFNDIIKHIDYTRIKIPKKNYWIRSKGEFGRRMTYADNNRENIIRKLQNRIV